jgi:hypothetical protein
MYSLKMPRLVHETLNFLQFEYNVLKKNFYNLKKIILQHLMDL